MLAEDQGFNMSMPVKSDTADVEAAKIEVAVVKPAKVGASEFGTDQNIPAVPVWKEGQACVTRLHARLKRVSELISVVRECCQLFAGRPTCLQDLLLQSLQTFHSSSVFIAEKMQLPVHGVSMTYADYLRLLNSDPNELDVFKSSMWACYVFAGGHVGPHNSNNMSKESSAMWGIVHHLGTCLARSWVDRWVFDVGFLASSLLDLDEIGGPTCAQSQVMLEEPWKGGAWRVVSHMILRVSVHACDIWITFFWDSSNPLKRVVEVGSSVGFLHLALLQFSKVTGTLKPHQFEQYVHIDLQVMNNISRQILGNYDMEALQHSAFVDASSYEKSVLNNGTCDLFVAVFSWTEIAPQRRVYLRDNYLLRCRAGLIIDTADRVYLTRDAEMNKILGIGLDEIMVQIRAQKDVAVQMQSEEERYKMTSFTRNYNRVLIWGHNPEAAAQNK